MLLDVPHVQAESRLFSSRHEHGARGLDGAPLRHGGPGLLAHHQHVRHWSGEVSKPEVEDKEKRKDVYALSSCCSWTGLWKRTWRRSWWRRQRTRKTSRGSWPRWWRSWINSVQSACKRMTETIFINKSDCVLAGFGCSLLTKRAEIILFRLQIGVREPPESPQPDVAHCVRFSHDPEPQGLDKGCHGMSAPAPNEQSSCPGCQTSPWPFRTAIIGSSQWNFFWQVPYILRIHIGIFLKNKVDNKHYSRAFPTHFSCSDSTAFWHVCREVCVKLGVQVLCGSNAR